MNLFFYATVPIAMHYCLAISVLMCARGYCNNARGYVMLECINREHYCIIQVHQRIETRCRVVIKVVLLKTLLSN